VPTELSRFSLSYGILRFLFYTLEVLFYTLEGGRRNPDLR